VLLVVYVNCSIQLIANVTMELISETLASYSAPERTRLEKKLDKEYMSHQSDNHEIYGMDYDRYLKSAFCKKIRTWVKTRDNYQCQLCGLKRRTSLEVHHRDYERDTLEGLSDNGLITLCSWCHHKVEFYDKEKLNKRDSLEKKELFLKMNLAQYNEWQALEQTRMDELVETISNMEVELHRYQKLQQVPDFVITARLEESINNQVDLRQWAIKLYRALNGEEFVNTRKSIYERLDELYVGKELRITHRATKKIYFYLSLPMKNQIKIRTSKHCDIDLRDMLDEFLDAQEQKSLSSFDDMLDRKILIKYKPTFEDHG